MQRIGLIGYGAIGRALHQLLLSHAKASVEVTAILVSTPASVQPHAQSSSLAVTKDLETMLDFGLDMVVECAGHQAVDTYAAPVLHAGIDLVLVSSGALADASREQRLRDAAAAAGRQILVPPGAIGGIDWLGAARTAGLTRVVYRASKPSQAWAGSVAERSVDLASLASPTAFFQGSAREAAALYPRNANVAATVALAGLGLDATQVELIADPGASVNVHEIEAASAGGSMVTRIAGQPDAGNARTSVMTAHSVLRTILNRSAAMAI
ncbi:aspartate dehydrogenase [Variovorax sp. V15]|uniref:aspartate dehydrogenase n=1 Tax=unclassified Variovorax TaxID=663243 RepID=UPI0034E8C9EA